MATHDDNGNALLSVTQAGAAWDQAIDRVQHGGERIVLTRRGKGVAVLVTMAELRALERFEDEHDIKSADKALEDLRSGKTKAIAWEVVKADLDRREQQHALPNHPRAGGGKKPAKTRPADRRKSA